MQCCRAFASMWIVKSKLGEHFFPPHFLSSFSKSIQTISTNKGFPKCFHILKGFKAFQSSRNCFKCSEKQIGFSVFSHGNFLKEFVQPSLAFKLFAAKTWFSTRNRIFSSTSIPLWWSKFFQIERTLISITCWNRCWRIDLISYVGELTR